MADIKNSGEDIVKTITRLIKADDIQLIFASTGQQACEKLEREHFDCVILDLGLPEISGYRVLGKIASLPSELLPLVIVYTGQEVSDEQRKYWLSLPLILLSKVRSRLSGY